MATVSSAGHSGALRSPSKASRGGDGGDSASTIRRLQQELMTLMMSNTPGISAFPDSDDLFHWVGSIEGVAGTVYEGMSYKLDFHFKSTYPYTAPTVTFATPCFHPNVGTHGNICLDILKEQWSASYNVRTILLSIQSLLGEPNIDSPLNGYAASLWEDQEEYARVNRSKYDSGAE